MLGHALVVTLLITLPTADPVAATRPATELRAAVHELLKLHATSEGARQDVALRDLAALYQEVAATQSFSERSQRQLLGLLRGRLQRASQELQRELDAADTPPTDPLTPALAASDSPVPRAILAQIPGNPRVPAANAPRQPGANRGQGPAPGGAGNSGFAAATERNAQELIDVIQQAIAPASWDVNGGLGTIRYFSPKQVLVIRQTGDIHDQIGAALQGLRSAP